MCEGVRVVGRGSVRLATAQEACTLTGRAEWEEQWRTALQQSRSRVSFWRGGADIIIHHKMVRRFLSVISPHWKVL